MVYHNRNGVCMKNKAFTLAEVLITLGIIGVVAALTMPSVMNNVQKMVLKNQFKKTYALISNAYKKAQADLDYTPRCYYWDKSPYSGIGSKCESYNASGECSKYVMNDGSPIPSDLNGPREDCSILGQAVINNLKVIKTCKNNAYSDGCIPDYAGNDTIKKASNDSLDDYDVIKATSGCGSWRKNNILNSNTAFVLADGQIILAYGTTLTPSTIFAVDVNGKKGPNKWGYDLFEFSTKGSNDNIIIDYGRCNVVEKNGLSTKSMLLEVFK